jgi:hypothetical protein
LGVAIGSGTSFKTNTPDPRPLISYPAEEQAKQFSALLQNVPLSAFYSSPRHATAGTAAILIGGPANIFKAIGVLRARFPADNALINDAARLLVECRENYPATNVHRPSAAILLKRLALVNFLPTADSADMTLTDRGAKLLGRRGRGTA